MSMVREATKNVITTDQRCTHPHTNACLLETMLKEYRVIKEENCYARDQPLVIHYNFQSKHYE